MQKVQHFGSGALFYVPADGLLSGSAMWIGGLNIGDEVMGASIRYVQTGLDRWCFRFVLGSTNPLDMEGVASADLTMVDPVNQQFSGWLSLSTDKGGRLSLQRSVNQVPIGIVARRLSNADNSSRMEVSVRPLGADLLLN